MYRFISDHKKLFAVRTMCRVLGVSVSSYYAWTQRPESNRKQEKRKIMTAIREIHKESLETYGSPRIANALQKRGFQCSRPRTARLMRELGIRAKWGGYVFMCMLLTFGLDSRLRVCETQWGVELYCLLDNQEA